MTTRTFAVHQISQIKDGGWDVVRRKCFKLFCRIISLPLYFMGLPVVLLVRIVSPFIQIRFGSIRCDVFGHFVYDIEYYLNRKEASKNYTLDLFYFTQRITPNEQWAIMAKRSMKIHPVIKYFDTVNRLMPGWEQHFAPLNKHGAGRDINGILLKSKPHITFTTDEVNRGQSFLKEVGMQTNDKFICVVSRDQVYKETYRDTRDWSYHSYRNSKIVNYQKTMNELANKSYFIFRMGKGVSGGIDESHKKIFDYANSEYRSDFLDIFLSANCHFFIVGESGLDCVPIVYRVPIVFVNLSAIEYVLSWHPNIISIPKKYWLIEKNRFMKFKEIFDCGAGRFLRTEEYDQMGIELIENTPDEIIAVSMEMHQRLKGTWKTIEEDELLQKRFWDIFPKSELHGEFRSRIGTDFLRNNKDLLF